MGFLANSELQRLIRRLCDTKVLPYSMKASLQTPVSVAWNHRSRQTYPSPEAEWGVDPLLFAEYVELCAQHIREKSHAWPDAQDLIQAIRNYGRVDAGWLDFKRARAQAPQPGSYW